jgi:methyl-accepting chemotaxis protein
MTRPCHPEQSKYMGKFPVQGVRRWVNFSATPVPQPIKRGRPRLTLHNTRASRTGGVKVIHRATTTTTTTTHMCDTLPPPAPLVPVPAPFGVMKSLADAAATQSALLAKPPQVPPLALPSPGTQPAQNTEQPAAHKRPIDLSTASDASSPTKRRCVSPRNIAPAPASSPTANGNTNNNNPSSPRQATLAGVPATAPASTQTASPSKPPPLQLAVLREEFVPITMSAMTAVSHCGTQMKNVLFKIIQTMEVEKNQLVHAAAAEAENLARATLAKEGEVKRLSALLDLQRGQTTKQTAENTLLRETCSKQGTEIASLLDSMRRMGEEMNRAKENCQNCHSLREREAELSETRQRLEASQAELEKVKAATADMLRKSTGAAEDAVKSVEEMMKKVEEQQRELERMRAQLEETKKMAEEQRSLANQHRAEALRLKSASQSLSRKLKQTENEARTAETNCLQAQEKVGNLNSKLTALQKKCAKAEEDASYWRGLAEAGINKSISDEDHLTPSSTKPSSKKQTHNDKSHPKTSTPPPSKS